MYARASYSADEFPSFMISESDADFASQNFYAGEPVCPQPSRRLEIVPYTYLFLLIAATVGCAFATDAETRQEWTSKFERIASSLATSEQAPSVPLPTKEIASADTPGSTPLAPPTPVPPPAAIAPPSLPLPEVTVAAAPGDTNDDEADAKTPAKPHLYDAYAPPRPSNDPLRKKAETAGLHPDLSRAVLARLTSTDYRNAAYAIGKAIKTVPNNGEFVWPHKRKAGLAVFTVHFVQGAGRDCRRYVVTVTKDRWTSTALPMEKCGVKVAIRGGKENAIE
jgi:hypothetical protein